MHDRSEDLEKLDESLAGVGSYSDRRAVRIADREHEDKVDLRLPVDRLQFWVAFLPEDERHLTL